MRATDTEYLRLLQNLLPQGAAWPRDEDAILTKLLHGLAGEPARGHNRALDLIEEADPRTTLELLDDWERVAGLPDECAGAAADTLQERRDRLVQQLTARGGQSTAFFDGIATALGYAVTIEEFRPFVCGVGECGDLLGGGHEVRFYWRVGVPDPRVTLFRAGVSRCGDLLGNIDRAEDLECLFGRLKPAHTTLIFAYEGA